MLAVKLGLVGFVLFLSYGKLCDAQVWRNVISNDQNQAAPRALASSSGVVSFIRRGPVQTPRSALPRSQRPTQTIKNPVDVDTWEPPVKVGHLPSLDTQSEPRIPVAANSIAVQCGEAQITVEVRMDFLGNGELITPSDLTLGGCPATDIDLHDQMMTFQSELQACGSRTTMSEDVLVYTFFLAYEPTPIPGTFIVKTNPATVTAECSYSRKQNVSSGSLKPSWVSYAAAKAVEQRLAFSLTLMTDDWQGERPSDVYFLGDVINIEAAVLPSHHVPLKVFVDSCVATLDPDMNAEPRYDFIRNYGCLEDSKQTGSSSLFLQRAQDDKLQFQLEAFRFHLSDESTLYVTCQLKARPSSSADDEQHKACWFTNLIGRWLSAAPGEDNQVCSCCEDTCGGQRRKRRSPLVKNEPHWEAKVSLGPIVVRNRPQSLDIPDWLPVRATQTEAEDSSLTGSRSFTALGFGLCGGFLLLMVSLLIGAIVFVWLHRPRRRQAIRTFT